MKLRACPSVRWYLKVLHAHLFSSPPVWSCVAKFDTVGPLVLVLGIWLPSQLSHYDNHYRQQPDGRPSYLCLSACLLVRVRCHKQQVHASNTLPPSPDLANKVRRLREHAARLSQIAPLPLGFTAPTRRPGRQAGRLFDGGFAGHLYWPTSALTSGKKNGERPRRWHAQRQRCFWLAPSW